VTYRTLELQEEELRHFSQAELTTSEVLAIQATGKFEIEPASFLNGHRYGIRSRGWVGHVLASEELLVRILPKVPVSNLFRMLEVAYGLQSFRFLDGDTEIESIEDLYERIVSILSRRVLDRSRKGLFRSYISEADDLPYVRGHIDSVATALNIITGVPRVACQYEEQTADLDDNRLLLWTLHQVRRRSLGRKSVRRELDLARRALAGTISLKHYQGSDCVRRLYHRLNSDYAPMHGLCRFILEQSGPGIEHGDHSFVPFELNMRYLFESFVAEWLRVNAPAGLTVRCKHSAYVDANFEMRITVDILLIDEATQSPVAVLDTKYKIAEQPHESDIYQIGFYAHEIGVKHALLVYPSPAGAPLRITHGKDVRLGSLVFDIGEPLKDSGAAFLESLIKVITCGREVETNLP
jgi:5-methylcytosine-specific restriction enzyme subunit McrC